MVIGGEPPGVAARGGCPLPASTEPPMVIGGEPRIPWSTRPVERRFNGAADGDRRRASSGVAPAIARRKRFNGAADGDRRRAAVEVFGEGLLPEASTEPPMVIGGERLLSCSYVENSFCALQRSRRW